MPDLIAILALPYNKFLPYFKPQTHKHFKPLTVITLLNPQTL